MSSIRRSRWVRAVSYVLLVALVFSVSPLPTGVAHSQGATRSVLLFPVTDESQRGLPEIRKIAADAMQMAIDAVPQMECTEFTRNSPLVRRASLEGRVLPTQIETGPMDVREAIAIGYALGVDTVLLASIQSYRSTQSPRSVEVILSGQAYDVKPNYDVEAGDPVRSPTVAQAFGVVGLSRKMPGYTGTDRPLAREAVADAAYRVAKVLSGATISEVAKPRAPERKRDNTTSWLAYAAAIGLLVWAVSSTGGEDTSKPSPDAIPPTPLPLVVEGTDTIRIRWEAPTGTAKELLRYQLQRSVNGGAWSDFGLGGASRSVDRYATEFSDFDVTAGDSYRYRIRAVYSDSTFSIWVNFDGITL